MQHVDKPLPAGESWTNVPIAHDASMQYRSPTAFPDQQGPPFAWIAELVVFLRRHMRLLTACVVVALLMAALDLVIATPTYTASATLLVDTRQSQLFSQAPSISDAQIENALIESEVEVLRSAGLARRAVSSLNLAADPDFAGRPSLLERLTAGLRTVRSSPGDGGSATASQDRLVLHFLQSVSARRVGLTYIIEVNATANEPVLAARLANGLVKVYLAEQLSVKEHSLEQAGGWLETRLSELQSKALLADQRVQAFKSEHGIVDTGRGLLSEQQLSELNGQLAAARGRTTDARARLDRVVQAMNGPVETSDLLKSPVINGLQERYLADAARVTEWSARYGPRHGAVLNLRKEMAGLQSSIHSEIRRTEQAAEGDLSVAKVNEAALQAQLALMSAQSASTDTSRAMLRSLQSVADTYRSLYVTFLQRTMQTAQDESSPVGDAHVVTEARPPLTKSAPKTKLIVAGAVVLGLAVAFAIALLRDALDQRVRTPAELRARTGLDLLACLPTVHRHETSLARFAVDHPDSPFALGVRRLQQHVVQLCRGGRGQVVGLIAPDASAGVSTVAASLVQALVRSGFDVASLDLSHSNEARPAIRSRLDALHRAHTFVVVEMPPLNRPEEAHLALADLNAVALVLRAGTMDGAALLQMLRDACIERSHLLGVVINRADQAA